MLDGDLEKADQRIASAESDVGKFDGIFQEAERVCEGASRAVRQARLELEHGQDQRKCIKEVLDEGVNDRHDLQVRTIYIDSMLAPFDRFNLGPTALHTRAFKGC